VLARRHGRVSAGRDLVGVEATAPELVLLGLCGAAFGSFVNVLAYRLPRRESIVKPRSRCPGCGTTIRSYDNVPIVSWLLLRGRCRDCGMRISVRYPLVEAVTAGLFVALGLKFGREAALWPALALAVTLVAAAATDLEQRIIPNRLMMAGAVLALVLWTLADPSRLPENLIAGAAAGGFLLIAALAYPAGMGMGDVKLAAVMGLFLGRSVGPALFVGFAAGAVAGMAIMAARGAAARKQGVPFAPFLALGGIVGLLFGSGLIDWYVDVSGLSS
jgi:leader peptidase (prepilin peptidase) / N-methyltransferase